MYTAFYNLKETPFSQSVDPKYTWLNEKQLEALADFKQNYFDNKGVFLITGDAGTGKTAFAKRLLAEIESKTIVATVADPDLEKLDFFNWLSLEFDMNVMFNSKGAFLTRFKSFLLAADQKNINVILIIDDAHRINQDLIEEILTLSNIEKAGSKLLSIFFVGQSGFNKILQEKQNNALRQRINAHFHLTPLKEDEIVQLISYRLKVAGTEAEIFSSRAFHEIYQFSAGYPRLVVNVCDRAMMAGCVSETHVIDKDLIIKCGKDLQIGGIKREREGIDHLNDIPGSKGPATKAFNEKYKGIKKSLLSDSKIRIGPAARTAILPAFLAILIIAGIYFIYQFKSSLLSWANSNLDQEKSSSVQSEPSEGKPAELSDDGYVLDELKLDEKNIFSDNQSAPTADESSVKSAAVDGLSDVDVNSESWQIRSDTEITIPSTSENKVTERFPEKTGTEIEETLKASAEIESEKESTDREFKMLSRRLALKAKLSGKERLKADIQEAHFEPKIGRVINAPPADDSKAREDVQPPQSVAKKLYLAEIERPEADIQIVRLEPKIEKTISTDPADDSKSRIDVRPQQSAVEKPQPQVPSIKPDLAPITKTQQAPDTEVAALKQVNKEKDLRNRLYLRERLESFLEIYCHTYERKDLGHFSTFFAPNAKENDKPFHKLLPKYRHNFDVIEFINYRIELQKFKYDDEHGTINIEGRFFLEWLPGGAKWRRNSGKIFMELQESGTSLKISRLNYYGDQQKKNQIGVR
jgi:type II secretory pathway predicted ATPase ExeA